MKQPNEMTDREMDEALATEVMGWHPVEREGGWYLRVGEVGIRKDNWHPTENLNQAVECAWETSYITINKFADKKKWRVTVDYKGDGCYCNSFNTSLARAICEAVLIAKRGEK